MARRVGLKRAEGIVEILEAFDLTGSFRAAASSPAAPTALSPGMPGSEPRRILTERAARDRLIDGYLAKG
jgi:hypothetical protein